MSMVIDKEWIQLIWEAKQVGITPEEIRAFLSERRCYPLKSIPYEVYKLREQKKEIQKQLRREASKNKKEQLREQLQEIEEKLQEYIK
jgi:DNA-binding transcriptional MerR regulator